MLGRDSEDVILSRFVFELVIWPQEVTLERYIQPSGPLCLWQCFNVVPIPGSFLFLLLLLGKQFSLLQLYSSFSPFFLSLDVFLLWLFSPSLKNIFSLSKGSPSFPSIFFYLQEIYFLSTKSICGFKTIAKASKWNQVVPLSNCWRRFKCCLRGGWDDQRYQ